MWIAISASLSQTICGPPARSSGRISWRAGIRVPLLLARGRVCGRGEHGCLIQAMGIRVVAADVGSVGPASKVGSAAYDVPAREVLKSGDDSPTAGSALVAGFDWGG